MRKIPTVFVRLVGPKVNGNPERAEHHRLQRHATAEQIGTISYPVTFDSLATVMAELREEGVEGIVWHHEDGRMAKLKVRDFR